MKYWLGLFFCFLHCAAQTWLRKETIRTATADTSTQTVVNASEKGLLRGSDFRLMVVSGG